MINGAHVVLTSTNPESDHALLRDVFKLPHVNDGGYICDDIRAFVAEMAKRKIAGGGKVKVYEPRHARPKH